MQKQIQMVGRNAAEKCLASVSASTKNHVTKKFFFMMASSSVHKLMPRMSS